MLGAGPCDDELLLADSLDALLDPLEGLELSLLEDGLLALLLLGLELLDQLTKLELPDPALSLDALDLLRLDPLERLLWLESDPLLPLDSLLWLESETLLWLDLLDALLMLDPLL